MHTLNTPSTAAMWIGRLILRIWMNSGGLWCKPITTTVRGGRNLSTSRISSTKKMSLRMLGIYLASPSPAHTSFDYKFRFSPLATFRSLLPDLGKGPQCCRAVAWCDVFTYLQPPELATDPQSALFSDLTVCCACLCVLCVCCVSPNTPPCPGSTLPIQRRVTWLSSQVTGSSHAQLPHTECASI